MDIKKKKIYGIPFIYGNIISHQYLIRPGDSEAAKPRVGAAPRTPIVGIVRCYGCYNSKLRSGLLNNSIIKYCGTDLSNIVEMDQDHQIYRTQQENFKKKKLCKYEKSRILIARQHFSMVLLWEQLHRDFLRFAN